MDYNRSVLVGSICGAVAFVLVAVAGVAWLNTGDMQRGDPAARQPLPLPSARPIELPDRTEHEQLRRENRDDRRFTNESSSPAVTSMSHSQALAPDMRRAAMEAVAQLADEPWQQSELALADAALSHDDYTVREEAVHALGERDSAIALQTLQQALRDPNKRVQQAALRALADMGGDRAVEILGATLSAEDVSMRLSALDALGQIGGPDATRYLRQALGDDSEDVRNAAAEWLSELTN